MLAFGLLIEAMPVLKRVFRKKEVMPDDYSTAIAPRE